MLIDIYNSMQIPNFSRSTRFALTMITYVLLGALAVVIGITLGMQKAHSYIVDI